MSILLSLAAGVVPGPARLPTVLYLGLAVAGVLLGLIDLRVHRLPHRVLGPAAGVLAVAIVADALSRGDGAALVQALAGAVVYGGLLLVPYLADPDALGGGDVKLAALLGLLLGWHGSSSWMIGVLAGLGLAVAAALATVAGRRCVERKADLRRDRLALGPWLILGAAGGLLRAPG